MSLAGLLRVRGAARFALAPVPHRLRSIACTACAPLRAATGRGRRQPFSSSSSSSKSKSSSSGKRAAPPKEAPAAAGSKAQGSTGSVRPAVPVTWTSLGLALVVGGGVVAYYQHEKHEKETQAVGKVTGVGKPALGGPFSLVTLDGVPVTDATYSGGYMMLYFGFTRCPDICPSELVKMGKIMERLDPAVSGRITPVFISLDCKRDSLEQLRTYSKDFHPKMQFLIGTPGQVEAAARAYRVYFSDTTELEDDDMDYLIDHSIVIYLISPDGEFQEFYTPLASVQECVERITDTVARCDAEAAADAKAAVAAAQTPQHTAAVKDAGSES